MAFRTGNQAAPAAGTATRPASRAPQFETAGTSALAPAAPGKPGEIETAGGDHFSVSFEEVRHFICAKATDAECKIFLETCRAYRLNPFTREAYLIHYDNKSDETPATIVLGKNCYLQMAERHPAYFLPCLRDQRLCRPPHVGEPAVSGLFYFSGRYRAGLA